MAFSGQDSGYLVFVQTLACQTVGNSVIILLNLISISPPYPPFLSHSLSRRKKCHVSNIVMNNERTHEARFECVFIMDHGNTTTDVQ